VNARAPWCQNRRAAQAPLMVAPEEFLRHGELRVPTQLPERDPSRLQFALVAAHAPSAFARTPTVVPSHPEPEVDRSGPLVEIDRSTYRQHEMATPATLTMTAKEPKNRTGEALRAVARGQRVLVTRRGRPLAVMASPSVAPLEPDERQYEEAWSEIEATLRATAPPESSWRRAMDRSRRRP